MVGVNGFTPTEQKIYDELRDGHDHCPDQLRKLLNDDMACKATLVMHISNLRDKIEPRGEEILCVWTRRRRWYRMVRRLANPYDGRS